MYPLFNVIPSSLLLVLGWVFASLGVGVAASQAFCCILLFLPDRESRRVGLMLFGKCAAYR